MLLSFGVHEWGQGIHVELNIVWKELWGKINGKGGRENELVR